MSIKFLTANKRQGKDTQDRTVTVKQGEMIPFDGEVIEGLAMVDESAIVGVSAPALIDETAGRNQVLKETLVVEGSITIRPLTK